MKTEMNEYEKGIFEFFSKPENFENMLKVAGHVDFMKQKILEYFWDKVIIELGRLNTSEKYRIVLLENISSDTSKILLWDKNWPLVAQDFPLLAVGIERLGKSFPYWGVWVNRNDTSKKPDYYNNLTTAIQNILLTNGFTSDSNNRWPVWKRVDTLDFNMNSSYLRILEGSECDELVLNIATEIFNFAQVQNEFLGRLINSQM